MNRKIAMTALTAAETLRCLILASLAKSVVMMAPADSSFLLALGGTQLAFPLFAALLAAFPAGFAALAKPTAVLRGAVTLPFAAFAILRVLTSFQGVPAGNAPTIIVASLAILAVDAAAILAFATFRAPEASRVEPPLAGSETRDGRELPETVVTPVDAE